MWAGKRERERESHRKHIVTTHKLWLDEQISPCVAIHGLLPSLPYLGG